MAKNLEEYREGHAYVLNQARQNAVAATSP
jgi:hypothetical protein